MKRRSWTALAAILVLVTPFVARGDQQSDPYKLGGDEAPLFWLIEDFLSETGARYEADAEMFDAFCAEFSIDPSWPSAKTLGEAGAAIEQGYLNRVNQQRDQVGAVTGQDPYAWKVAMIGRTFGEVYAALREDGLPWDLNQFVRLVETEMRPQATRFSTEPFEDADFTASTQLLWEGLAEISDEAEAARAAREER